MANITGPIGFTGKLQNISAYRMRGSDKIILRMKGGASKERIKTHPNFDMTRRHNSEWIGCTLGSKRVRLAMRYVAKTGDYNYTGALNAVCKKIQHCDTVNGLGERMVAFSNAGSKLDGFNLNKYHLFDSVVRQPLQYSVDRATGTATVSIPALKMGDNLSNPLNKPLYRFVVSLATLQDVVYNDKAEVVNRYEGRPGLEHMVFTGWNASIKGSPAADIQLSLADWQNGPATALLLCIAIEFGIPAGGDDVVSVKYAGAGKILKVV